LADFYDRRQQSQQGVDLLEAGIAKMIEHASFNPTPQMYSFLGVAYAKLGNTQRAIDANLKVVEIQPNNVGAMRNLALLYREQGNTPEALGWVEKATALLGAEQASDIKQLRSLAAQIYQEQGQTEQVIAQVIAQYEAIRQVVPQDLDTLKMLNTLYTAQQNDRMVVEIAQALMALEPTNFQYPLSIAQALQRAGQPDNARTFAEQALSLAPDDQKPAIQQLIADLSAS